MLPLSYQNPWRTELAARPHYNAIDVEQRENCGAKKADSKFSRATRIIRPPLEKVRARSISFSIHRKVLGEIKMGAETTRRVVLIGGASIVATSGLTTQADAFVPRWVVTFTVGVAAGWMLEALKHWGLVPGSRASTSVASAHEREAASVARQGYSVRPMYSGAYSGGDFELSEATRGDEFLALSTTKHGSNTCTPKLDKADSIHLGLVSSALHSKGLDTRNIQACVLPLHPNERSQLRGDRRHSPDYMTPSHGTIAWSTNVNAPRGNFATTIRSPVVNANLRFAQLGNGRWTFDMARA